MRKYWAFYLAGLQRMTSYRGPLVLWALMSLISLTTIVAVWLSSSSGNEIAGYTKNQLITYAIIGVVISGLITFNPFGGVKQKIKDGSFATIVMLKPYSFFTERLVWELTWKSVAAFFNLTVAVVFSFFLFDRLDFSTFALHPFLFFWSLSGAALLQFSFTMCLALIAFWFTEIESLNSLKWIALSILGGSSLPITFIPDVFQTVIKILPFRYMYSLPLEIILNKISADEMHVSLLIQLAWIFIFVILYKLIFSRGVKKYVSVGQ